MENMVSVNYKVNNVSEMINQNVDRNCISGSMNTDDMMTILCDKLYTLDDGDEDYMNVQYNYICKMMDFLIMNHDIEFGWGYQEHYWHFNINYVSYWINIDGKWGVQRYWMIKDADKWLHVFRIMFEQDGSQDLLHTRWKVKIGSNWFNF